MDGEKLASDVARKTRFTVPVCNRAIREIAAIMRGSLARGERVVIRGLGVWAVIRKPEQRLYSFKERAKATVPARWKVEFRAHQDIARLDGALKAADILAIATRFRALGSKRCTVCGVAEQEHDLYIVPGPDGVMRPSNRCPK